MIYMLSYWTLLNILGGSNNVTKKENFWFKALNFYRYCLAISDKRHDIFLSAPTKHYNSDWMKDFIERSKSAKPDIFRTAIAHCSLWESKEAHEKFWLIRSDWRMICDVPEWSKQKRFVRFIDPSIVQSSFSLSVL